MTTAPTVPVKSDEAACQPTAVVPNAVTPVASAIGTL